MGGALGDLGGVDDEAAAVLVAIMIVVAMVSSSIVALGLAAAPAESTSVPDAIDAINAHNDRVRAKIAACYERAEVTP